MKNRRDKLNIVGKQLEREYFANNLRNDLFSNVVASSFSLYKKDLLAHYGCVNAVEFSEDGSLFVSGSDDRRVLLWRLEEALVSRNKFSPTQMEAEHGSNVFCLAINPDNTQVVSGGNDHNAIIHDINTAKPVDYFLHERPVYGISLQPGCPRIFATACDDGKLRIFDTRSSSSSQSILISRRSPIHSVMFHPVESRILAVASAKDGTELLDIRVTQKCLHHYPSERGAMSARFNATGDRLLCLRRREPPIIYHPFSDREIKLEAEGYSNACTMKSCCFAGSGDEWAVSGSDDHNVYVWKVPLDDSGTVNEPHMVLKGHRSVVNHVRYNTTACSLASSGVEKMVKFWSPLLIPGSVGGLDKESADRHKPRKKITRDFSMIIAPSPNIRSVEEDKKMLAFFDLLVERSVWVTSDEDSDDDDDEGPEFSFELNSSISSSVDESGESQEESFQIESLSTPSSSSVSQGDDSTDDDEDNPVAGPSGVGWVLSSDATEREEPRKLELPASFASRRFSELRRRTTSSSSSDSEEFKERECPDSQSSSAEVSFRRVTRKGKRELRSRRWSSSSSSSSTYN